MWWRRTGLVGVFGLACGNPSLPPPGGRPQSTGSSTSPDSQLDEGGLEAETASSQEVDPGVSAGDSPPDCSMMLLPGWPTDIAASARPDHDAEVLALPLDPMRAVASEAHYEMIAADLVAIRTLEPHLASIHVECAVANGLLFSLFDDEAVNQAILAGDYHAWDCHHSFYEVTRIERVDQWAVAIEFDGVYGPGIHEAYGALEGLGDYAPYWFERDDGPTIDPDGLGCSSTKGSIELDIVQGDDGTPAHRRYRFISAGGETTTYTVADGQRPTEEPPPRR